MTYVEKYRQCNTEADFAYQASQDQIVAIMAGDIDQFAVIRNVMQQVAKEKGWVSPEV